MATIALEALAILSTVAGGIATFDKAAKQREALKQEAVQQRITADIQTLQREDQLERVVNAQQASFGARGLMPSSTSFRAVTADSFNQFAQDQRLADLQTDLEQERLKKQQKLVEEAALFDVGKSVFGLGASLAAFGGKQPTAATTGQSLLDQEFNENEQNFLAKNNLLGSAFDKFDTKDIF